MKGGSQMTKDKKVLYIVSLLIFAVLLVSLFVPVKDSKILTACLLIVLTVVTRLLIRKRTSFSINKKEVILLSAIIGVLYVVAVQLSGIYFGFYQNPYLANLYMFFTTVIPIVTIIITSEIIRSTLLAQKNTFVSVLAFLSCLLVEILAFSNIAGITSFNRFMDLVGLTFFPAISANIYYHYASRRFGAVPNIVFRMITTLYIYVIPTVTGMSDAIFSMIKLVLPLAMYALISALFEKKKKSPLKKTGKLSILGTVLASVVIVSIAMLISCQFRFGAIVIATESMTGEINKGDMIIYEEYKDQKIEEGQVIVFLHNKNRIIHRVSRIETIGGETRYYTKGDANSSEDTGYRTDSDIVGLTDMKIAYAGYPTLWLRELIKN